MNNTITEGLIQGDLDDLVRPIISVDEYESKISDDNIVVGFYVLDNEPAIDLARFISKSEIDIMDAEVSSIPTDEGYYIVFVEFLRDETFPDDLISMTESMRGLTGITTWEFKAYKRKKAKLSLEALKQNVRLVPKSKTARLEALIKNTANVIISEGVLYAGNTAYSVVAIGNLDKIMESYKLDSQPVLLESSDFFNLGRAFGYNWAIQVFESYATVCDGSQAILLKLLNR